MSTVEPDISLAISIGVVDDVVVAVAGELDVATARDFEAVLDALVDRGHRHVTIDCRELHFMDASGIGVLAGTYARLRRDEGELRIRGVSALAYRTLEITELLEVLQVERPNLDSRKEFSPEDTDLILSRAARLAEDSARSDGLADTLARLTERIPRIMSACAGATVTLRRADSMITPAASDDTVRYLDNMQYVDEEGPCVDAANSGVQTHAAALAQEQRWPTFAPQARSRGIESILSSPLIRNGESVGALNLYARAPDAFRPEDQGVATLLAEHAAMLLHEPDPTETHAFDDRIRDALASRDIIAKAQGILMERLHVDPGTAFLTLRRDSVRTSIPMRDHATSIVTEGENHSPQPDPHRRAQ